MDDDVVEKKMGHHAKKAPPVEPEHKPEPEPQAPATTVTMPPIVGQMTASVGVPENAIAEVKSLVPAYGNANMITVATAPQPVWQNWRITPRSLRSVRSGSTTSAISHRRKRRSARSSSRLR